MHVNADLVLETAATTGTGTLTLAGAATGYLTFAAEVGEGNTCAYTIQASNGQLETGVGTVVGSTLERTTLVSSSTGSKLDLPAGTHQVGGTVNSTVLTWYAYKPGLSGGQTLIGGTGVTDALTLQGTSGNGTATSVAWRVNTGNNGDLEALSVTNNGTLTTKVSAGIATPNRQAKNSSGTVVLEERTDGNNLFLGLGAGAALTTGGGNTALGSGAHVDITEGQDNTAIGNWAQPNLTLGDYNTALGSGAQVALVTGNGNVALGDYSQYFNVDGDNNVAIGHLAGAYQANGSTPLANCENSVYIGVGTRGKDNNDVNSIVVGYGAIGLGANTTVLGNASTTITRLHGDLGLGVDAPSAKAHFVKTTEQLRLGYDASNYASFTVSLSGVLNLSATGGLTFGGSALGGAAFLDVGTTAGTVAAGDDSRFGAPALANGKIFVGNITDDAVAVTMSGDATLDNTGALTIAADAVTYAKIQNVSDTDKLLGRATAGSGIVEEIACTAAGRAILDDVDASAQRSTLGLGSAATTASTDYATAAQGSTADTALQPGDAISIADINLDGGTDIGADLTDTDLILVDDGATGTNRKSALSRVWTYITAKITAGIRPLFLSYKETVYAITDGAAFAIDPTNGSVQTITLGASRTPVVANFDAGHSLTLMINDGTAYTITWTTIGVVWVGGSAPTLATSGYTVINLWKVGTTVYGMSSGAVA